MSRPLFSRSRHGSTSRRLFSSRRAGYLQCREKLWISRGLARPRGPRSSRRPTPCKEQDDTGIAAANVVLKSEEGRRFLSDLSDAALHFRRDRGYLGHYYFCNKWRLPLSGQRSPGSIRSMLEAAEVAGIVSLVESGDGGARAIKVDPAHPLLGR